MRYVVAGNMLIADAEEERMAEKLNPVMDYDEHNKTYDIFIGLIKYGTIATVLILILMAVTLL